MENKTLAVMGLGYVGLPLALLCAKKGHKTYGIDIDKNKIDILKKGINPLDNSKIDTNLTLTDESVLSECKIIVVCVPTPIDQNNKPDLSPVISCINTIKKHLKKGQLVIIESSVNPGAIDDEVKPILGQDMVAGKDFYLAHCPERIDPGNKKWDMEFIPRVLGACSKQGLTLATEFYKSILEANIKPMSSIKAVEAVKMVENSFRDVNIAFANEMAKIFDKIGLNTKEIIEAASTKPFAFLAHYPSCGVGGHCIPVDPYYLIQESEKRGYEPKFLKLARELNNSMPHYTISILKEELSKIGKSINLEKVGILGLSYKANINDLRNSPAAEIIKILKKENALVETFDPYSKEMSSSKDIDDLLKKSEYIILTVDHNEFKSINPELFERNNIKIIIDGKNVLNKEKIKQKGILYRGIGSK